MAPPSLVTPQGPGFPGALTAAITVGVTPLAGIPQSRSLAGRMTTHALWSPCSQEGQIETVISGKRGQGLCTWGDGGHGWNGQGTGKFKTAITHDGVNSISLNIPSTLKIDNSVFKSGLMRS